MALGATGMYIQLASDNKSKTGLEIPAQVHNVRVASSPRPALALQKGVSYTGINFLIPDFNLSIFKLGLLPVQYVLALLIN